MSAAERFRRAWPVESRDLLLRAALLPQAPAREAWEAWNARFDIERSPWADVRLLGSVAKRIDTLQPDYRHLGRLKGIRRFVWSQSQMCLAPVRPLLRSLAAAGIPLLLMKGTARHATDPASAADRLLRDVDVLVPVDRAIEAFEHARAQGWALWDWQVQEVAGGHLARHNAWSLRKEGGGEVDLHHFSIVLNRMPQDDAGLWQRSRAASFQGIPVRLPSPADSLLLAIVHGVRYSGEGIADWAIDAAAEIARGGVDWSVLAGEARARRLEAPVFAGLSYLRERLGRPVPDGVLDALGHATEPFLSEFASFIESATPRAHEMRAVTQAASLRAIDALVRQGKTPDSRAPQHMLCQAAGPLLPEKRDYRVQLLLPKGLRATDRLRVRFEIEVPPESWDEIHVTIGRPDLYLLAEFLPPDASGVRALHIDIPAALLVLRGLEDLLAAVRIPGPAGEPQPATALKFQLWGPGRGGAG